MAYEVMDTLDNGDTITAEIWRQIRNNWLAGAPECFTVKGAVAAGTGADAIAEVAPTSSHQFLTADSGETAGMKWSPLGVRLKRYAASVETDAKDIAADESPNGIATLSDNYYVCQQTGLYLCFLARAREATYRGYIQVVDGDEYDLWGGASDGQLAWGARLIPLTAGDHFYFKHRNFQSADAGYAQMLFVRLGVTA